MKSKLPLLVSAFHSKTFHVPVRREKDQTGKEYWECACGAIVGCESTFAITSIDKDAGELSTECKTCRDYRITRTLRKGE